ncbi:TetR family transcriptional regulator [Rhodococcus qingshengii]|nr:TetR family transcriptional regulator [Rhodococcus qingshengii]
MREGWRVGYTVSLNDQFVDAQTSNGIVRQPRSDSVKRRPKDRKAQIAAAAAIAFSERGYPAVSVDDIASAVGISGSALYRHFPNKYAMFRHAALELTGALASALDAVSVAPAATDAQRLREDLIAVIRTTIRNRRTAGIYRWESRFLDADDRKSVRAQASAVNRRVARYLSRSEPAMTARDETLVVAAMFSVIGSITVHNLLLPQRSMEKVLLDACLAIDQGEGAITAGRLEQSSLPRTVTTNKRERLLQEAVRLFDSRGYHDVSIEEIAAAAGLNASGMYRYFPSKAELLGAVFYRAADRLDLATAAVFDSATSHEQVLRSLSAMYVELSFAQHELMSVYFSEMNNLLPSHRSDLKNRQKLYVVEWARVLGEIRPELSAVEAKFVVHAALNLVPDVGRMMKFDAAAENAARLQVFMSAVLFGRRASAA